MVKVPLGVLEENTSSIGGVSNILRHLHKYVPSEAGQLRPVPCHGDGLAVERMHDAAKHNSCGETSTARLEGIVPVPQEFHRRMLLLEVTLNSPTEVNYVPFLLHQKCFFCVTWRTGQYEAVV